MKKIIMTVVLTMAIIATAVGSMQSIVLLYNGFGPRPLSLGGAYIAVGGDPESVFWNPGGIPSADFGVIEGGYQSRVGDINFFQGYGAVNIPKAWWDFGGTVGLGVVFWSTTEDKWNLVNELEGKITASEYIVALGYKKEFAGILSIGATVKLAGSDIDGSGESALTLDVGGLSTIQGVGIGLMVRNIGFGIGSNATVPMGMGLGAYYTFFQTEDNMHSVAGAVEMDSTAGSDFALKFGAEYTWNGLAMWDMARWDGFVKVRLGYDTTSSKELGILAGLSGGLGINYAGVTVNYTFLSLGVLGMNHDVTLSYNIDNAIQRGLIGQDTTPPEIMLSLPGNQVIVMGEAKYDRIGVEYLIKDTVGIDKLDIVVKDSSGKTVKQKSVTGLRGLKEYKNKFEWDGKNEAGQPVLDDIYSISVETFDLNFNKGTGDKPGLIVSSDPYGVILGAEPNQINATGEQIKLVLLRKVDRAILQWRITIKDEKGTVVRRLSEKAETSGTVGEEVKGIAFEQAFWDATDDRGNRVSSGDYFVTMDVEYDNKTKRSSMPIKVVVKF